MNNLEVMNTIAGVYKVINFLYTKKSKYFFINIILYDNTINISIIEKFTKDIILDINIKGNKNTYNFVTKQMIKMIINNNDVLGYLTTFITDNQINIDCHKIKTNNIEMNIAIYDYEELLNAEYLNCIMSNKQNKNNIITNLENKIYTK